MFTQSLYTNISSCQCFILFWNAVPFSNHDVKSIPETKLENNKPDQSPASIAFNRLTSFSAMSR